MLGRDGELENDLIEIVAYLILRICAPGILCQFLEYSGRLPVHCWFYRHLVKYIVLVVDIEM